MANFRLDRLSSAESIVSPNGMPSQAFQRRIQKAWAKIETAFDDLTTQLTAIQAAQAAADARPNDMAPVVLQANSAGVVLSSQVPKTIYAKRFNGVTDVTASSTWSATTESGAITYSIGAATGIITITGIVSTSVIVVTSVHNGVSVKRKQLVTLAPADPATGSGGGTTATDNSFNSINSTTHAAISDELTITIGSAGIGTLTAPLTVTTAEDSNYGTFPVFGKWQWWDGAAWADLAAEIESHPDVDYTAVDGLYTGTLTCSDSKTGLAASSSHKFRLMARNSSGTRIMQFTGTASAVGS